MDMNEVRNTIQILENGETTFDSCTKLAALYAIQDHYNKNDVGEGELREILPQYRRYCDIKRRHQFNEIPAKVVYESMTYLCIEIQEFVETLYSGTGSVEERTILNDMLQRVTSKCI